MKTILTIALISIATFFQFDCGETKPVIPNISVKPDSKVAE
jgi:hypothetical protein